MSLCLRSQIERFWSWGDGCGLFIFEFQILDWNVSVRWNLRELNFEYREWIAIDMHTRIDNNNDEENRLKQKKIYIDALSARDFLNKELNSF